MSSEVAWVVRRVADDLKFGQPEVDALRKYLWKNFIRDIDALEAVCQFPAYPKMLHPVVFDSIVRIMKERRDFFESQRTYDRQPHVTSPEHFTHTPIYIHRLYVPLFHGYSDDSELDAITLGAQPLALDSKVIKTDEFPNDALPNGYIVQTLCLDISSQLPFNLFQQAVSLQLGIPLSVLQLFTALVPPDSEENEDSDTEYAPPPPPPSPEKELLSPEERAQRMVALRSTTLTLAQLRIGPGTEVFAFSSALLKTDVLAYQGARHIWGSRKDILQLLPRIPLPPAYWVHMPRHKAANEVDEPLPPERPVEVLPVTSREPRKRAVTPPKRVFYEASNIRIEDDSSSSSDDIRRFGAPDYRDDPFLGANESTWRLGPLISENFLVDELSYRNMPAYIEDRERSARSRTAREELRSRDRFEPRSRDQFISRDHTASREPRSRYDDYTPREARVYVPEHRIRDVRSYLEDRAFEDDRVKNQRNRRVVRDERGYRYVTVDSPSDVEICHSHCRGLNRSMRKK